MRNYLLLMVLVGVSLAAPIGTQADYETAARQFFGSVMAALKQGDYGNMFDQLLGKWEQFHPDFLTEADEKLLKEEFIAHWTNGRIGPQRPTESMRRIHQLFSTKYLLLNNDARRFMKESSEKFSEHLAQPKIRAFTPVFAEFRARYDELSDDAKTSLTTQFPFFTKLDELQGMITVSDDILVHVIGLCKNFPGVKECDNLMSFV